MLRKLQHIKYLIVAQQNTEKVNFEVIQAVTTPTKEEKYTVYPAVALIAFLVVFK